jgi:hypothetical protein
MDTDTFFLETLADLTRRTSTFPSEYEALMASGLLRKLLLESVVDSANRERRLKITYAVNDRSPAWELAGTPPPVAYAVADGFDPDTALTRVIRAVVNRDGLLARRVMLYRNQDVTVKDLIRSLANVEGGVHLGEPRNDAEAAASAIARMMRLGQYPAGVRTLMAVGRVVTKGLEPLRAQVVLERGKTSEA